LQIRQVRGSLTTLTAGRTVLIAQTTISDGRNSDLVFLRRTVPPTLTNPNFVGKKAISHHIP
jgi:hypothetical protein